VNPRHGHVVPRPDGAKARCGGRHLCGHCAREQRQLGAVAEALHQPCRDHWAEVERRDPGRMQTMHGLDAHTDTAFRVLLVQRPRPGRNQRAVTYDDRDLLDYMKQLWNLEAGGERTTLAIGPYSAITLIGGLQLAMRHPEMGHGTRDVLAEFIDQLRPLFAGTPGEELIRRGDDAAFDGKLAGRPASGSGEEADRG
jgi:hypothetical protein